LPDDLPLGDLFLSEGLTKCPLSLYHRLGQECIKELMLCDEYNCCDVKKKGSHYPKMGAKGPLDEFVGDFIANV